MIASPIKINKIGHRNLNCSGCTLNKMGAYKINAKPPHKKAKFHRLDKSAFIVKTTKIILQLMISSGISKGITSMFLNRYNTPRITKTAPQKKDFYFIIG